MTLLQAIILGIVQGFTEFLPISSSAHLFLVRWILGLEQGKSFLEFDLICHVGTLGALIFYLRKEITNVLKDVKSLALLSLALIPLVPVYMLFKPLRTLAANPMYLGYFFMITGLLLWIASCKKTVPRLSQRPKWQHVLCIGFMQSIALFPGISRSGSTIATARLLNWSWVAGARFSFLLAIPTILGGGCLEAYQIIQENMTPLPLSCLATGLLVSFLFGLLGVRWIFWIYRKECVLPFAIYCFILGLITWGIFNG